MSTLVSDVARSLRREEVSRLDCLPEGLVGMEMGGGGSGGPPPETFGFFDFKIGIFMPF